MATRVGESCLLGVNPVAVGGDERGQSTDKVMAGSFAEFLHIEHEAGKAGQVRVGGRGRHVGEGNLVGGHRFGTHFYRPHRRVRGGGDVNACSMADSELRELPVGHGEAALFRTVGLVAATHRFRARQEHRVTLLTLERQLDLEKPGSVTERGWLRLSVDQEQRDEPVTVVTAGTAAQEHPGVVVVELLRLDVALMKGDSGLPARGLATPEHRRTGVRLTGDPLVAGPGRDGDELSCVAADVDRATEGRRGEARDVRRGRLGRWVTRVYVVSRGSLVLIIWLDGGALRRQAAEEVSVGGGFPAEFLIFPAERAVQVGDDHAEQFVPDDVRRRRLKHGALDFFWHGTPSGDESTGRVRYIGPNSLWKDSSVLFNVIPAGTSAPACCRHMFPAGQ